MGKILPFIFSALVIMMLIPQAAPAEIREGAFELSPFVGYCSGSTSSVLCHKDIIGVRAGYLFTKNWELEGVVENVFKGGELFHVDALYHIMPENKTINPFLLAGFGWAHIRPRHGDNYSTPMADIGAGVKVFLTEGVALRTDFRNVITHSQNAVVTAGLTFSFGGKKAKAAPAPQPAPVAQPEPRPEPAPVAPPSPAPEKTPEPAPRPAEAPAAAPAIEPIKVVLEDVHFAHNSSALTEEAKAILAGNIKALRDNPGMKVEIEGHTSAIGSDSYNMKLSVKRANTVRDYLVREGVAAGRLTAVGYGERLPAMVEKTPKKRESAAAKANRREIGRAHV